MKKMSVRFKIVSGLVVVIMLGSGWWMTATAAFRSAPVPQVANRVTICTEGCTITSISLAGVQLQMGTNAAPGNWSAPFAAPALPQLVSCSNGCAWVTGGDPDPQVVKEIDALEGPAAYTVQWTDAAGAAHTTPVPALPIPQALMANAFKVCSACTVTNANMAVPLYLQLGSGTVYNLPFLFSSLPVGSVAGDIYAQESLQPFTITETDTTGSHQVTVPAAPAGATNPAIALARQTAPAIPSN